MRKFGAVLGALALALVLAAPAAADVIRGPFTATACGTGEVSKYTGGGTFSCVTPAGGGDVTGPSGGVVDNEIAAYSGTTGKIIKSSGGLTFGSLVTTARSIATSGLLTGGGDLSANRTLSIASQDACTVVANATAGSAAPTAVTLGTGLACSGGQLVATGAGGSGDVVGPASAVDSRIAAFDGTTGKLIKDGGTTIAALTPTSRTITAGTGLSGGGDLTTNRTLSLAAGAAAANLGFTPVPDTRTVSGTGMLAGGGDLTTNRTLNLAAAAANSVVMNGTGSSAVPTAIAVPACTDSGGNHLNYSSGVFSCGTSSSGGGSLTTTDGINTVINTTTQTFDPVVFTVGGSGGSATVTTKTTINPQSGTSYTVVASDANKTVRTTNASAVTLDLTAAATLGAGFGFYVECDGAAGCTVDPAGSETIDGAATLAIATKGKAFLQTDGSSWRGAYLPAVNPLNAGNITSGLLASTRGGAGTVSGILKANGAGTVSAAVVGTDYAAATAGSANTPLFNNGSGGFTNGTRSGNTTAVVTKDASSPATNDCAKWDASGNLTTAGAACGTSSGITSANATIGWVPGVDLAKAIVLGPVSAATTVTDIRGKLIVAEGSAATIMVRKAASTEDCTAAAGADAQTTATFNLNTTAPANQNLTLVTGAANTLAAGDSLCLEVTGTTTTTKGSINVTYTVP